MVADGLDVLVFAVILLEQEPELEKIWFVVDDELEHAVAETVEADGAGEAGLESNFAEGCWLWSDFGSSVAS